jgi:hypothetical protein
MKTLAETLGETSHLSPLVRKFRRLGFDRLSQLKQLTVCERVEGRLRYIAEKGREVEPDEEIWQIICEKFPLRNYPAGLLPHADRFTTDLPRRTLTMPRQRKWLRV